MPLHNQLVAPAALALQMDGPGDVSSDDDSAGAASEEDDDDFDLDEEDDSPKKKKKGGKGKAAAAAAGKGKKQQQPKAEAGKVCGQKRGGCGRGALPDYLPRRCRTMGVSSSTAGRV